MPLSSAAIHCRPTERRIVCECVTRSFSSTVQTLRFVASVGVVLAAWYFLAGLRTATLGNHEVLRLAMMGLVLTSWLCMVPFIGWPLRAAAVGAGALYLAALASAIIWASVEEQVTLSRVQPASVYVQQRWWPFTNHELVYVPGSGWHGGD